MEEKKKKVSGEFKGRKFVRGREGEDVYSEEYVRWLEEQSKRIQNAEGLWKKIVELCNKGAIITFEEDFGDNTLTISVNGNHTHVGVPDGDFSTLLEHLNNVLSGGPGLSFHPETPEHIYRQHDGHEDVL